MYKNMHCYFNSIGYRGRGLVDRMVTLLNSYLPSGFQTALSDLIHSNTFMSVHYISGAVLAIGDPKMMINMFLPTRS